MKKLFSILFMLVVTFALFSCNNVKESKVSIITPGGTPLLAVGALLENDSLDIEAVSGTENLQAALASGSHDIVIAPVNLGVKFGISNYKIAAVITMNNAYIVTRAENKLDGVEDLIGQEILAFGKAGVPGGLLKKLYSDTPELDVNSLDNWYVSSKEVYGLFKGESVAKYALMSEPEISTLILNDKIDVKVKDLCELLNIEVAPQACIYVNPNSENQDAIKQALDLIKANIEELNLNPEAYAEKVLPLHASFGKMGKAVIVRSIPLTSISYRVAQDVKADIENILSILGVAKPNDDFYYQK